MKEAKIKYDFSIKSKEELKDLSYEELIEYTKNLTDEWHKKNKPKKKLFEEFLLPLHLGVLRHEVEMEILKTSPKFLALVLVVYGAILSGFTGGAIIASGLLYYALSQRALGREFDETIKTLWEGISSLSGIAWALWIFGFIGLFINPDNYLVWLLLAGLGLVIKVGSKLGLIGYIGEVK